MVERLSARAAASVCGVDERTVRRWVKSGHLAADKQGGRFLIPRSALEPFIGHADGHSNGQERTAAAERTLPDTDAAAGVLELVRLVDRLQRENRDLAGLVGSLQERTANLQAQLALPAGSQERPFSGDSERVAVEPTQTSSETPRRAWWHFWHA